MATDGCTSIPAAQGGTILANRGSTTAGVIKENSVATFKTQVGGVDNPNLFNGNEASLRLDYNWNANNRFFINYNYHRETDKFGPCNAACTRGFSNPLRNNFPQGSLSFVHTFSPSVLNELRAGYVQGNAKTNTKNGGIPAIGFGDGSAGVCSFQRLPPPVKQKLAHQPPFVR